MLAFYHVVLQSDHLVVSGGNLGVGKYSYEAKGLFIVRMIHMISCSWGGCSYKVDVPETRAPCEGDDSSLDFS